jgi:hypothetical protein
MVFFDIETNINPNELIEFGAIIVDKFVRRQGGRQACRTTATRVRKCGAMHSMRTNQPIAPADDAMRHALLRD